MVPYASTPLNIFHDEYGELCSFLDNDKNIDHPTIRSFSKEWEIFSSFTENEIETIGSNYFDLLPDQNKSLIALDVGCGSGRWAYYLAKRMKFIETIDPSDAVFVARRLLRNCPNTRVTQASVERIPFPEKSFDLVYSLGVLHHVPNTLKALQCCFDKVKPGGYFLVYLYYSLEQRGKFFRLIFTLTDRARLVISKMPTYPKLAICEVIALLVYWPMARLSSFLYRLPLTQSMATRLPLFYYRDKTFKIMRNDALDRFGTPLEKRFTKNDIAELLSASGFVNIRFSNQQPFWHAIAQRP